MSQEKFEDRLNEVLDQRLSPSSDPELVAMAAESEEVRQRLASAEALFAGLDVRQVPAASEDLADRVTQQLNASGRWTTTQIAVSLAVAATLLLALVPMLLPKGESDDSGAVSPVAGDSLQPGSADEELVLDESQKEYLAMLRTTGEAMATFPTRLREATQPLEAGPVAEGFRPVGVSFSAAIHALRQTLPHKPADSES